MPRERQASVGRRRGAAARRVRGDIEPRGPGPAKVAIVHDWLTGMRGGEKCLEVFCELFPRADIYTLLHRPGSVSSRIERHRIETSFVQRLPRAHAGYRYYLPVFPLAIRRFDLRGYDLVLSSSHCVAKGVDVPPDAYHVAYTYTPMRYVWDQFEQYFGDGRAAWHVRGAMRVLRPWLQRWDAGSSRGVDDFVAISRHVANRIREHYGRESTVIYPPVDVDRFRPTSRDEGYYLMVTALAPYKRVDVAVEAFNRLGRPLRIIGSGPEEARLRRIAGPNVTLHGWRSDAEVREAYAGCRALVFPGEEDFGIVPLEAMASGKPVIAYGRGGALETVIPLPERGAPASARRDCTGLFFHQQTPQSLAEAVHRFEAARGQFDPRRIRRHAEKFARGQFKREIRHHLRSRYEAFAAGGTGVRRPATR